jgi:hypothetical protein
MLDVLGLADQIADRDGLLRTMRTYNLNVVEAEAKIVISQSTMDPAHDAKTVDVVEFVFDTLVVVSRPIEERGAAGAFMGAVSALMASFASSNMPLRGAIGVGDYLLDEATHIFLSDVFKKLSNAINAQEWSGCLILPEYESQIMATLMAADYPPIGSSAGILQCAVPMKGQSKVCWCVNWLDLMNDGTINSLLNFMVGDKKSNTQQFIERFRPDTQKSVPVPCEFLPARSAVVVNFGDSFRFTFYNDKGESVRFGCQHFTCDPRKLAQGNAFIGYTTEEERVTRHSERWTN